jgi:hypothetical protein
MDRRFSQLYSELRDLETQLDAPDPPVRELAADWTRFEERIRSMRVPATSTRALYTLREHARLARERLQALQARAV